MSLFSKITSTLSQSDNKLPNRFLQEAFSKMGSVSKKPRNNSVKELVNSINTYAKENPEIAEFAK